MKLIIAYSPDPVYMSPFITRLVHRHHETLVAVLRTEGSALRRRSRLEQLEYFLALLLVLGVRKFVRNATQLSVHKLTGKETVSEACAQYEIPVRRVSSINAPEAISYLKERAPDILFNQSQHILKEPVLNIPRIGVLNRHGALLPRYRGRLAPFWQILHGEKSGGLTYHLLDEGIDSGPIVYQEAIPITNDDDFNTFVARMFDLAVARFGLVLEMLQAPDASTHFLENKDEEATYYSSPGLYDALAYRWQLWKKRF